MSNDVRVLLIAGLGRSGSTLIDRALGQPAACLSLGEVVRLWERGLRENALCACGSDFRSCAFWGPVGDAAFGGWDRLDADVILALQRRVDRTRFIPQMITGLGRRYRRAQRDYAQVLTKLYRGFVDTTGARLVIDSSKDLSTTFLLRSIPGIELKVVHLVRDPRAVAYSWTRHVSKPGAGAEMDRYAPAVVGLRYLFTNVMLHLLTLLRTPRRFLRYEDFVAHPAAATAELLGFAGATPADLGFIEGTTLHLDPHHSVGGNPMRFSRGAVEVRLDDRWRKALPRRDRVIVTTLTWPLLLAYRYAGPGTRS